MDAVLKLPQLNNSVICREHMHATLVRVSQEFERVDLLIELKAFQMVKLWLVRLDFGEVSIVEVARIFQIRVSKDNDAAALVAHGEILSSLVKFNGGQDVGIVNVCSFTLAQSINIDPIGCFGCLRGAAVLSRAGLWTGIRSWISHWYHNSLSALIR